MYCLLTVSGKNRLGMVCEVSAALKELDISIDHASMAALRGRFAMMMVIHLGDVSLSALRACLAALEQRSGLSVCSEPMDEQEVRMPVPEANAVIALEGADRAGIVHAVSAVLLTHEVDIIDLSSQSLEDEDGKVYYVMAMEVAAVRDMQALSQALAVLGEKIEVHIDVHPID